jgi:hypothetical protein
MEKIIIKIVKQKNQKAKKVIKKFMKLKVFKFQKINKLNIKNSQFTGNAKIMKSYNKNKNFYAEKYSNKRSGKYQSISVQIKS